MTIAEIIIDINIICLTQTKRLIRSVHLTKEKESKATQKYC